VSSENVSLFQHILLGLARTIYMRCKYGVFGREITNNTVIYGVYLRFWPTLYITCCKPTPAHTCAQACMPRCTRACLIGSFRVSHHHRCVPGLAMHVYALCQISTGVYMGLVYVWAWSTPEMCRDICKDLCVPHVFSASLRAEPSPRKRVHFFLLQHLLYVCFCDCLRSCWTTWPRAGLCTQPPWQQQLTSCACSKTLDSRQQREIGVGVGVWICV
jgi:hypothetical protein